MIRREFRNSIAIAILIASVTSLQAADRAGQSQATRPYYSLYVSSIDRLVEACNIVFQSVERPELAESLSERQKSYRDFAGIDRDKPLGMMSVWEDQTSADIVFAPVKEIDELLKTATFGVVDFHAVGANRFEIARPGSPYHVLVRNDYAFFADSVATIQGLRITPEQLTRTLRDRYDVVVQLNLNQIPTPVKVRYVEQTRAETEPWLQPQDDEPAETANLRKAIGKLALDLFQRVVLDTTEVTIGGRLDPETHHLIFEVVVEAAKGSPMAGGLNRLVSRRSEFGSMISQDVPAGLALNLPLGGLVEQILGSADGDSSKGGGLEMGLQIVGDAAGKLSLIAAVRGEEAAELNKSVPRLILKLDESRRFASVNESFDIHEGVVFHSMIPREMPTEVTQWIGTDLEIIVGQGSKIFWVGMGPPELLVDQMKSVIDSVGVTEESRSTAPLVRARFQAKKLPELLPSELLSSNLDTATSRDAFEKGEDGFNLTLEPVANGIKLRIEMEEGFVRLIGRDWVRQIDGLNE